MLRVLARPIDVEVTKHLERLHETTFRYVPRHTSQEHTGGIGGVLVTSRRELATPGTDDIGTWEKERREREKCLVRQKEKQVRLCLI